MYFLYRKWPCCRAGILCRSEVVKKTTGSWKDAQQNSAIFRTVKMFNKLISTGLNTNKKLNKLDRSTNNQQTSISYKSKAYKPVIQKLCQA